MWDREHGIFAAVFRSEEGGETGHGRHRIEVDEGVAIVVDVNKGTLTGTAITSIFYVAYTNSHIATRSRKSMSAAVQREGSVQRLCAPVRTS